jgi:hypothetical protein
MDERLGKPKWQRSLCVIILILLTTKRLIEHEVMKLKVEFVLVFGVCVCNHLIFANYKKAY